MARSPEPGGLKPSLEAIRLRGKACPRGGECGSGPAPPFPQPVPALYDRSLRGSRQYYPLFFHFSQACKVCLHRRGSEPSQAGLVTFLQQHICISDTEGLNISPLCTRFHLFILL